MGYFYNPTKSKAIKKSYYIAHAFNYFPGFFSFILFLCAEFLSGRYLLKYESYKIIRVSIVICLSGFLEENLILITCLKINNISISKYEFFCFSFLFFLKSYLFYLKVIITQRAGAGQRNLPSIGSLSKRKLRSELC